jgi:hypothetical protein
VRLHGPSAAYGLTGMHTGRAGEIPGAWERAAERGHLAVEALGREERGERMQEWLTQKLVGRHGHGWEGVEESRSEYGQGSVWSGVVDVHGEDREPTTYLVRLNPRE